MKKSKKIALLTAAIMVAVGIVSVISAAVSLGFDFTKMNTVRFKAATHTVNQSFTSVSIDAMDCDVKFYPSENRKCEIKCDENEKVKHTVSVKDGTLTVKRQDSRKWYERIGIYGNSSTLSVYLPKAEYKSLKVSSLSGDIYVPNFLTFASADIQTASGDISYEGNTSENLSLKSVSGDLNIDGVKPDKLAVKTTSGDIKISHADVKGSIQVKAVSGEAELENIKGQSISANSTSGDITFSDTVMSGEIRAESVSGNITLKGCDAATLNFKSTSGDVEGSLLTGKVYTTDTKSGDVDVPNSTTGGKCTISTVSGNIKFS